MGKSRLAILALRGRDYLLRHGLKATIGRASHRVQAKLYLDENHVWYELPLGTDRPRIDLRPGLEIVQGEAKDLSLLEGLPTVSNIEAKLRLENGNYLYLVLDDRQLAFACWIFYRSLPMVAARSGQLALPPKVVCLEDSITSSSYRGQSIAPAAWSQIANILEQDGVGSVITKIDRDNIPTRKSIVKPGFHEIATMHHRRTGPRRRTIVHADPVHAEPSTTANWLADQLAR